MDDAEHLARRPVPARDTGWAHRTAPKLQRLGLTPNQISIASVVFAAVAAVCFVASARVDDGPRVVLLLIAAGVYLADVKPALDQVTGRGSGNQGPYGPW